MAMAPDVHIQAVSAAFLGDLATVINFIANYPQDIDVVSPLHDRTLLYGAVRNGHMEIVRLLANPDKHGFPNVPRADVNKICGQSQTTALHAAMYYGQVEAAKYLIRHTHANIRLANVYGLTPLEEAKDAIREIVFPRQNRQEEEVPLIQDADSPRVRDGTYEGDESSPISGLEWLFSTLLAILSWMERRTLFIYGEGSNDYYETMYPLLSGPPTANTNSASASDDYSTINTNTSAFSLKALSNRYFGNGQRLPMLSMRDIPAIPLFCEMRDQLRLIRRNINHVYLADLDASPIAQLFVAKVNHMHLSHDPYTLPGLSEDQYYHLGLLDDIVWQQNQLLPPDSAVKFILAYHGCTRENAKEILKNGLYPKDNHDTGYFARAPYVTPHIRYAAKYCYRQTRETDDFWGIVACLVAVKKTYPVTRTADYATPENLGSTSIFYDNAHHNGMSLRNGFDSHLIPVKNYGYGALEYQAADRESHEYLEIAVEDMSQILPLAAIIGRREYAAIL